MATITVPAAGTRVSGVTLNDTLQPGSDVDPSGVAYYEVDGVSTLRSLYIGSSIEVILGYLAGATVTGAGAITGATDTTARLPILSNYGYLDIDGGIDVGFYNNNQLVVGAGERLDIEGDLYGLSASTIAVAPTATLVINSVNTAIAGSLAAQGAVQVSAPNTLLSGPTTLGGAVLVHGDAANAQGSGVFAARSSPAYVATLDLRSAVFSAPINDLTLGQDAQIRFGASPTSIRRLVIAGSASALAPLDVVNLDGAVTVTGDGSGAANQVAISRAEFAGSGTIRFAVAASDGGASLQQTVLVDPGATLRNDAAMTLGGAASAMTIDAASFQNAGAITVAGDAALGHQLVNTGTIDITAGTLSLAGSLQGPGVVTVESGAVLSLAAAATGGSVVLRNGATLRLSLAAAFADTIQAPATGAHIDLAGVTATAATVANGSIAITAASGPLALAETGLTDGTPLTLAADGAGGTLLTAPSAAVIVPGAPSAGLSQPVVYRFFDQIHGTHFFTASLTETQMLQATRSDLFYEGVGLEAVDPASDANAAPVYRFFDTRFGTHFYTSSTTERDDIAAHRRDLTDEGIGFYEHLTALPGDAAVYRFFDGNFGTHFYTASASERTAILTMRPDLVDEGIGFYAPAS